jgi:hypothetical protein
MKFKHIMLVGLAALALTGCNRVSPGTVGVQVTNWALFTPAGVDPTPKPVGTYQPKPMYGPNPIQKAAHRTMNFRSMIVMV